MKPRDVLNRPSPEKLREMVESGMSDVAIAAIYGCSRQNVQGWRKTDGIVRPTTLKAQDKLSHDDFRPWGTIRSDHQNDPIWANLRVYSTMLKDDPHNKVGPQARGRVNKFVNDLLRENLVIDYNYDTGFKTKRRDPAIDAPGDIIRRTPKDDE